MRRKGISPAAFIMVLIALAFAVFLASTRFGMDLVGPPVYDLLHDLHDATGWYEGAKAADR
jgi:ABC-type transporter Mla subunit MlaD